MEKLKVAIIGCGGIANGKHMPSLAKLEEVSLSVFCDLLPERAQKAAKDYGTPDARVYTDYKELLDKEKPDVVHVLTPNRSHAEISVAALNAGCHVMCEKPMAKTVADARAMLDAAKKSGKKLTIGYQSRQRVDAKYLKRICDEGELGDIYFAKAHAVRRRAVPTWGVFLNEYEQGGGPLIDIGTHALDLTLWCMNNYEPLSVTGVVYKKLGDQKETGNAWGDWDPAENTVEDSAFGFITMKNGATIYLEASWALNTLDIGEAKTTLCGTKAGADMRDSLRINLAKNGTLTTIKPDFYTSGADFYDPITISPSDAEAEQWIKSIINDTAPTVLPEQAFVVTEILEAIYTSAKTGKPVLFD